MDSVQQLVNEFTEKLLSLSPLELGISQCVEMANKEWKNFYLTFMSLILKNLDDELLVNPEVRPLWVSRKKVSRRLVTVLGELDFTRRYFENRKDHSFAYLLDALVGVEKYERIDKGAKAEICNWASEDSYRKSSDLAVDGIVSKTSVMRIVREADLPKLPEKKLGDLLHEIHMQADEDHVAMQDGSNKQLRLVVLHEPRVARGKKGVLVNPHYTINHSEGLEDFWDRVWTELCRNYNLAEDCKIYIHGDGASWIRHGVEAFDRCYFVLDKFHALKYLRKIAPKETAEYRELETLMYQANRSDFTGKAKSCFGQWGLNPEKQEEGLKYLLGNWRGIKIWHDLPHVAGSCAEGLVSHCLSERFSMRPMAWRNQGLDAMAKLREYRLNGGKVVYAHFKGRQSEKEKLKLFQSVNIKVLKEKVAAGSQFDPMPTSVFQMAKRGAMNKIFEKIKYGGRIFNT